MKLFHVSLAWGSLRIEAGDEYVVRARVCHFQRNHLSALHWKEGQEQWMTAGCEDIYDGEVYRDKRDREKRRIEAIAKETSKVKFSPWRFIQQTGAQAAN